MSFSQTAKRTRTPIIVSLLIVLAVATAIAITAFTQTSPSTTIPAPPPPASITPACTTLANFTKPASGSGSIAYSCTGQTDAFTVANAPTTGIATTPIIRSLPSTLTLAFYSGVQGLSPCPGSAPSATIINNTQMFIANGNYNYCVFYTGLTTSLTFSFSVTWS